MKFAKNNNKKGFTLVELLIVVAIVIALAAIAFVSVSAIQKKMRQEKLDYCAELIYYAAQNQITRLAATDNESLYNPNVVTKNEEGEDVPSTCGAQLLGYVPGDANVQKRELEDGTTTKYPVDTTFYYVSSDTIDGSTLLPSDIISAEVWDNNWVIEYDPDSAYIYAVYYSEDASALQGREDPYPGSGGEDANVFQKALRLKEKRLQDGARVGYYGGDSPDNIKIKTLLPTISVYNGETLYAAISCPSLNNAELSFSITVEDSEGHKWEKNLKSNELGRAGSAYTYLLMLDDLSDDSSRFANIFTNLVPGSDITITVYATSDSLMINGGAASVTVNSLFDSLESSQKNSTMDTAIVSCGRHLQNLDYTSKVTNNTAIKYAVQKEDISFYDDGIIQTIDEEEDWYTYYNKKSFRPILNEKLVSYSGCYESESEGSVYSSIFGLSPEAIKENDENFYGGLFESINHTMTLSDITLVGTTIPSFTSSYMGSLVGKTTSDVTITRCSSVLTPQNNSSTDWPDSYLKGIAIGGLIGYVQSGTVKIDSSYAATVIGNEYTDYAGGLIGYCTGTVNINQSYADCYLYAERTGGLVGFVTDSGNLTLTDCYATGYQKATSLAAGLSIGKVEAAVNVYSTCIYVDPDTTGNPAKLYYTATSFNSQPENVFYLNYLNEDSYTVADQSAYVTGLEYDVFCGKDVVSDAGKSLTSVLNGNRTNKNRVFSSSTTAGTTPYNLMNQSLSVYTYPSLIDIAHYGDWYAKFSDGKMVYFEAYQNGTTTTYGFYGANVDTLSDDLTIVGDGYGIAYSEESLENLKSISVTYTKVEDGKESEDTYTFKDFSTALESKDNDGETYYIIPLPAEIIDSGYASEDFWQKITVTETSNKNDSEENQGIYYYNPDFAQVLNETDEMPSSVPATIAVRTARQLNALSKNYATYADKTAKSTFNQELDISYKNYEWTTYTTNTEVVTVQRPIGDRSPYFKATYNGNCHTITGVSFQSATDSYYVGMFGRNEGTVKNVFLTNEYADGCIVSFNGNVTGSSSEGGFFAGTLAGCNGTKGLIQNCAVSGYQFTINAFRNSSVYIGGLVGRNMNNISYCSAETPYITITATDAEINAAGFVGWNNGGTVRYSYAIGAISVPDNKNSTLTLAGFCSINSGFLQNNYCTTAIRTSGEASIHAFSPLGGSDIQCSSCYYLNKGSYYFLGEPETSGDSTLYTFDFDEENTNGTALPYESMQDGTGMTTLSLAGFDTAKTSLCHAKTDADAYPFPTSVTDKDNNYVHNGDWLTSATSYVGVFYWEHEEGGTNPGYHISFYNDNSNLCDSHDDGGVITEYGYGVYYKSGTDTPKLKTENFTSNLDSSMSLGSTGYSLNSSAKSAFEVLMPNYVFYPYETISSNANGDLLRLNGNNRNGTWTVTYCEKDYVYTVCPFFADAFDLKSIGGADQENYVEPGLEKNSYQIRSTDQMQFINWNYQDQKCDSAVTEKNYTLYPYLQYATVTSLGRQTQSAVENTGRSVQYWEQTHDIGVDGKDTKFYPIAGTATGSTDKYNLGFYNGSFNAVLYTWFGGNFDGHSYKMINMSISSTLNNIGIFGYTCNADLKNIILYSDKSTVIERVSSGNTIKNKNGDVVIDNGNSSYAIGGLVGIAYDYLDANGDPVNAEKTITNCAIAGYVINDSSENYRISCGDINIGGLFGVVNANLSDCTAVVDINVDCSFKYLGYLGNTVRVGGVAGCCPGTINRCYSGGSITVGNDFLSSRPEMEDGYNILGIGIISNYHTTYVYAAGICSGCFGGNFMNFTNKGSSSNYEFSLSEAYDIYGTTIHQEFIDCYTYMDLTACREDEIASYSSGLFGLRHYETGIKASMGIGGVPERGESMLYSTSDGRVTINNCYYLEDCIAKVSQQTDAYWIGARSSADRVSSSKSMTLTEMTDGTLGSKLNSSYNAEEITEGDTSGYKPVTTKEPPLNEKIPGKYTFPGDNAAQTGMNYPFPTIITQENAFGYTVCVHYGEWATGSLLWSSYLVDHDILQDGVTFNLSLETSGDTSNENTLTLSFYDKDDLEDTNRLTTEDDIIVSVVDGYNNGDGTWTISKTSETFDSTTKTWNVRLTAKASGMIRIKGTVGSESADCQLNLDSEIFVEVTPEATRGYIGDEIEVQLRAYYRGSNDTLVYIIDPTVLSWALTSSETAYELVPYEDEAYYHINGTASSSESYWSCKVKLTKAAENLPLNFTATYTPDGTGLTFTGEDFMLLISQEPSILGIANNENGTLVYSGIEIPENDKIPETSYNSVLSTGDCPAAGDTTFYLYAKGSDVALSEFLNNASIVVTKKNDSDEYVACEDYYLEFGSTTSMDVWNIVPITFNSSAGDYNISISNTLPFSYYDNATDPTTASGSSDVTYTVSLSFSREEASDIKISYIGYFTYGGTITISETTCKYGDSMTIPTTDSLTLPSRYYFDVESLWYDSMENSYSENDSFVANKDMVFSRDLTGNSYEFTFVNGEKTYSCTLVYGEVLSIPLSLEMSDLFGEGETLSKWTIGTYEFEDGQTLPSILDNLEIDYPDQTEFTLVAVLATDSNELLNLSPEENKEEESENNSEEDNNEASEESPEENTEEKPENNPEPSASEENNSEDPLLTSDPAEEPKEVQTEPEAEENVPPEPEPNAAEENIDE